jgi:hypothetical protein
MGDRDQSASFCGSLSGERVAGGRDWCPWMELAIRHDLLPVITQLHAIGVTRLKVGSTRTLGTKMQSRAYGSVLALEGQARSIASQAIIV